MVFHNRLRNMLYNNFINNVIGTHESVYRDSPIGNLERFLVKSISPLQQGFYSDCNTGFSVAIDYLSAFALEQRIIGGTMPLPNSTAVSTPFTGMPTINYIKCNMFVKTPCNKVLFESEERNPHNFPVELLSFRAELLEVLYRNVSIILNCKVGNVPDNLTYPICNKVMFLSFGLSEKLPCKTASVVVLMTLQDTLSFKYVFPSYPDILAKITLAQNLPFWTNNRNSKAFAIHINSKDISLSCKNFIRFGKVGNNLEVRSQSISLANPALIQQSTVSLPVAILDNGNSDGIPWINPQFDKAHRFSGKGLTVAGNIEFDSNAFGDAFASPDRAFNLAYNLNIKRGNGFGS